MKTSQLFSFFLLLSIACASMSCSREEIKQKAEEKYQDYRKKKAEESRIRRLEYDYKEMKEYLESHKQTKAIIYSQDQVSSKLWRGSNTLYKYYFLLDSVKYFGDCSSSYFSLNGKTSRDTVIIRYNISDPSDHRAYKYNGKDRFENRTKFGGGYPIKPWMTKPRSLP